MITCRSEDNDQAQRLAGTEVLWRCAKCGELLSDAEVFAGGYGHDITEKDGDGKYVEAVCGPCERIAKEPEPAQTGGKP